METKELKCTDLRIGNWVVYNNQIVKTTGLHYDMFECGNPDEENWMCTGRLSEVHPIELTEEVLVGLFSKPYTNGNKFDIYNIPIRGLEIQDRRKSALPTPTICIVKFGVHICNIKYLHQLQNAYYLLTGEEMEVNL